MRPIQLAFLLYIACGILPSSLTPHNTLHFSHDRSNWSPSFSSNTFQNFPDISYLLSEVSKFQHNMKLCFICSTLLASSSRLSPICWWKSFLLVECCFCHGNPGFNSLCTSCIICYASQIVEILHFLQLFLICLSVLGMLPSRWRIYTDKIQNKQGVGHIWVMGMEKPTVCHYAEDVCMYPI